MIWKDSVKNNGLRFFSRYCITLFDVTGEDSVLFYWQREVVQSIKCRGANSCGTRGFVKKEFFPNEVFHFLRINVFQLKVGRLS